MRLIEHLVEELKRYELVVKIIQDDGEYVYDDDCPKHVKVEGDRIFIVIDNREI